MAGSPYVALARLRFGAGFIEIGEAVPVEEGRDYGALLRADLIAVIAGNTSLTPPAVPAWDAEPHAPGPAWGEGEQDEAEGEAPARAPRAKAKASKARSRASED